MSFLLQAIKGRFVTLNLFFQNYEIGYLRKWPSSIIGKALSEFPKIEKYNRENLSISYAFNVIIYARSSLVQKEMDKFAMPFYSFDESCLPSSIFHFSNITSDSFASYRAETNRNHPENSVSCKQDTKSDHSMDPKKLKRLLSNRVSAQKSRMKKFQYVRDMETKVKDLEAQIRLISSRFVFQEHHYQTLKVENELLNQKLSDLAEENFIKDALLEQKKAEVQRLVEVYVMNQQRQKQGV